MGKVMGRAARILEKQKQKELSSNKGGNKSKITPSHMKSRDNLQAAMALKESMNSSGMNAEKEEDKDPSVKLVNVKVENIKIKGMEKEEETEMDLDRKDQDKSKVKNKDRNEDEKKRKFEEDDGGETNKGVVGLVG